MIEVRSLFKALAGKSVGKTTPGRPRRTLKDNIKMYLTQDRDQLMVIVHMVMYLRV
jgi:hypothetical protein